MSTATARRSILARLAALALALGAIGVVDAAVAAPDAAAAACYGSNLTSRRVKNVNCTLGAYGSKSSAGATSATRVGAWAFPGNWSSNPTGLCFAFPTMVHS